MTDTHAYPDTMSVEQAQLQSTSALPTPDIGGNPVSSEQNLGDPNQLQQTQQQEAPEPNSLITAESIANMTEEELENLSPEDIQAQMEAAAQNQQAQSPEQLTNTEGNVLQQELGQQPNTPQFNAEGGEPNQNQNQSSQQNAQQPAGEGNPTPEQVENLQNVQNNLQMTDAEFRQFLTSEFRANNANVRVDSAEDIRKLMQMGMNYQKKLGSIRPHLRIVKSLEKAGLLEDEDKLNTLIDIANKDPKAIASYLKQNEIDAIDLPDVSEEDNTYYPNNHIQSEQEFNFEDTVAELKKVPSGNTVLNTIGSWDDASKEELYESPELLNQLTEHVDNGLFQDTMSILTRDAALGKIPAGTSHIEAYNIVATQLLNSPERNYLNSNQPNQVQNQATQFGNVQHGQQPQQAVNQNMQNGFQPQMQAQNNYQHQEQYQTQAPIPQQRVVGNNLQQNHMQNPISAKQSAGIPQQQHTSNQPNYVDPLMVANMSEDDLDQYGDFQQFVQGMKFKK